MLQALVVKGVLSPSEAVDIVDKCLAAVVEDPELKETAEVAEVACSCLEGVREGLAEMAARN